MEHALIEDTSGNTHQRRATGERSGGHPKFPFLFAAGVYLLLVAILGGIAIHLNGGKLVYTLDDPYIHLAFAEHLWQGHFGVNSQELSAPSSSILWPFILAPFAKYEWSPLILNILFSIGTLYFTGGILNEISREEHSRGARWGKALILSCLVLAFNLVGLTFIGMEHTLQVMLVLAVVYALVVDATRGREVRWLWIALILAALVRYENLAIVVPAIGFMFYRGRFQQASLAAGGVFLTLFSFTLFLYLNGLGVIPTSIAAKAVFTGYSSRWEQIYANVFLSLTAVRWGAMLCAAAAFLLIAFLFLKNAADRGLALLAIFAIAGHITLGQYGWYNRYEVYIVAFTTVMLIYLFRGVFVQFLRLSSGWKGAVAAVGGTLLLFTPYVWALFTLPVASNNIYEQQYQMHRFVTEYYQKPVAVNDLGWVVYKNDQFVLDLVGLASTKVLESRKKAPRDFSWMDGLTKDAGAKLAMVYDSWFPGYPPDWKLIGVLQLGRQRVTPASHLVSFYSLDRTEDEEIRQKLREFAQTLPGQVKMHFARE